MFRVGIVGCGGIAQVHGAVLEALEGVQLVACADIIAERAEKMAAKYGCKPYTSLEEMLENEKLDSLHICTPHALHTPMACMAAEKGIAVFTEKPPVVSREQWAQLKEAAEKVPLGVCLQNRYNPPVEAARRLLASGEMGKTLGARGFATWHRDEAYYAAGPWRANWATAGGGALINQTVHTLDLVLQFLGTADTVESYMTDHHLRGTIEVEDTVEAYLRSGEKTGLFFASTAYPVDAPVLVEIQTEKGFLRIENDTLEIHRGGEVERQRFEMPTPLGKSYWGSGHFACIRDFYDSITEKRPFMNSLAGAENTIEVMLRIYERGREQMKQMK